MHQGHLILLCNYPATRVMAIAEKYLAPQAKELSGLKDVDVQLQQDAIEELIRPYCRESGLREDLCEPVFRDPASRETYRCRQ
ncbi:Similar to Lon protease homolog, mitochondrial; acc. no. Q4X0Z7 [Pyronema omphalodes CBS 100304]|uniref:Similar to Lon protease homolog, mitochondrial acc. no. Q4X0Z7 n=1 Tax=Pyronema omphalodes (strain CBS 100304) TaxID=1076935 RepID=U4L7L5_PYROM|nr:Similar to Lon protease homolog, mitochondrial; acc. no. Q4X0Z7 [Pyronema omphalodes CBS 100304]